MTMCSGPGRDSPGKRDEATGRSRGLVGEWHSAYPGRARQITDTTKPQGPWHLWTGAKRSGGRYGANGASPTIPVSDRYRYAMWMAYRGNSPRGEETSKPANT
jgi:hypothetical protein